MNVKSIERNGNEATIVVEIDKDLMESGVNKAYLKARKQIMIPGFRKGKAPRKMIEAMYGAHVFYEDGLEEIFPEVYDFAVAKQEGLKAIGRPSLTDMQIGEDGGVTLTLTTEVYPEVTLGQYKGLEVEKAEATVTDEQVQAELDRMAQNVASTETVERAAEMGDTANIDFEGFDNGVPFEGGKGENFDLKLGSGQFVPGFEEQVVGMSAGEEKDIDITFPEDYHKDLAGKPVVFHVKLNKVTVTNVPEQDDEFAKDVSEFDTLEELKADIRAKALEQAQKQIDSAFENAAVEKAAENTTVDMPKALVENELDTQMERFAYQLQMSGYSMEQYAKMMGGDVNTMRNAFRPAAEKQAKISVTLEKIVEVEGLTASEEEIEEEFKSLAEQYQLEVDKVKEMVPMAELTGSLTTRKAVKVIVDSAVPVAPKAEEKTEA
ncbi:MAG: trigger factor [Candidatus Faecousia sp.]|nr:trigger factor [Clostridiales bacterium]MCI6937932.1 trigger factor [Clostridiales bacterium]MDD5884180.1 trigger factor [Bacillota bacterium]MDY4598315.1 trigger factor [Candidatus Faecousia sp.]